LVDRLGWLKGSNRSGTADDARTAGKRDRAERLGTFWL